MEDGKKYWAMQKEGQGFRRGMCVLSKDICPLNTHQPPPHPFVYRTQRTSRPGPVGVCVGVPLLPEHLEG